MGGICGFSFCYQVSDSCCMRTVLETRLDLAMILIVLILYMNKSSVILGNIKKKKKSVVWRSYYNGLDMTCSEVLRDRRKVALDITKK